jgi:hypothetical protein
VDGQVGKKPFRLVVAQHQVHGVALAQHRLQQAEGDELGDLVADTDHQSLRAPARSPRQRLLHLAPEQEDLVGVAIDEAPDVGEREVAPALDEELLPEGALEHPDLRAHGRLREVQLLARLGHASGAGDGPEVE